MIIAFGGLGGSGKTTQIKRLQNALAGNRVDIITLRDCFLWPEIVGILHKKKKQENAEFVGNKKNNSILRSIYLFLRNVFYIFDSWRIYFFIILPKSKKVDFLFIDRYFYDFFTELFYPVETLSCCKRILLFLIPHTPFYLYFRASARVVFERKHEFPEEIISVQEKIYNIVLDNVGSGVIVINGESEIEITTNILSQFLLKLGEVKNGRFDVYAFILFEFLNKNISILKSGVFIINPKIFLNIAGSQKVLLKTLFEVEKNNVSFIKECDGFYSALEIGKKKKDLVNASSSWVREQIANLGIRAHEMKSDDDVEAHSDLDVVFLEKGDYAKFIACAKENGARVVIMNETKADVFLRGDYAPIDIHCGVTFGGSRFFDERLFFSAEDIANILMIISHAFSELTLFTLGDRLRVFNYTGNKDIQDILLKEAKKFHWRDSLGWWLTNIKNDSLYWVSFPQKIPVFKLIKFKIRSYTRASIKDIIFDIWNTLRAIRGRRKHVVPFHEPWFTF